jgi:hypothetical protein
MIQLINHLRNEVSLSQRFATRKGHAAFTHAQQSSQTVEAIGQCLRSEGYPRQTLSGGSAKYLRFWQLAFRIVAPRTAQRTALQENGYPQTWPVMHSKFLDVKHNAGVHLK